MKTKMNARAVAAALLLGCAAMASAHAENNWYAGVAYTQYNMDGSGSVGSVTPSAATFNVGYAVSKNLAIEGRFAAPMNDGSTTVSGVKVNAKVESHSALYIKGILPLNETVSLYGLVGTNSMTLKATASSGNASASASATQSSSSYGVGAEFAVNEKVALNLEWARHFSDTSSASIGVSYKF